MSNSSPKTTPQATPTTVTSDKAASLNERLQVVEQKMADIKLETSRIQNEEKALEQQSEGMHHFLNSYSLSLSLSLSLLLSLSLSLTLALYLTLSLSLVAITELPEHQDKLMALLGQV